jgi:hypothetical protein
MPGKPSNSISEINEIAKLYSEKGSAILFP